MTVVTLWRRVAELVRLDSPLLDEPGVRSVTESVLARAVGSVRSSPCWPTRWSPT